MATLVAHSIASLFPEMTVEEFAALKADIAANGQREPIWLHDGRIIDGRHRYRACLELDIQPRTRIWEANGSLTAFVVSLNLHRRSLTSGQRAAIAFESLDLLEAENAKVKAESAAKAGKASGESRRNKNKGSTESNVSQKIDSRSNDDKSTAQAAKLFNTNRQYVADVKQVAAKSPELVKELKAGTKTIQQAKSEIRKSERLQQLEEKAANAELNSSAPLWTLIHADVIDGLSSVRDHHAAPRLIFADPPYNIGIDYGDGEKADRLNPAQYMLWFAEWIGACWESLAADGSLWVMIGDEYAAEYATAMKRTGFTIRSWIKWYETFGVNCSRTFNRTSRHIFYAVKNAKSFVFNESAVTRPSDRQLKYGDKRAAEGGKIWDDVWQIPRLTGTCDERIPSFPTQLPLDLLLPIVGCASDPGDLVVDPFNGSGTTGVAAITLKRKYVGIDKSSAFIDLADKRLRGVS